MLSQNQKIGILALLFFAFFYHSLSDNILRPEPPAPIVIPVPSPEPEPLQQKGCDLLLAEALDTKKQLLIVFWADWCGFCRTLKQDLPAIIDLNKYVICLIDVDNKDNKELVDHFKVKIIPTSILVDSKENKEIKRMSGYEKTKYSLWIK